MFAVRAIATPLFILAFCLIPTYASADASSDFHALLDETWEWQLDENPVWASMLGDRRANDKWGDNSLESYERAYQARREQSTRLRAIDPAQLTPQDQLNYDLFRRELPHAHQSTRRYAIP